MEQTLRAAATDVEPMLVVSDLQFAYGGSRALDGCSLDIARDGVTGLIGPNGAGKSTLLEVLSGALRPQGGEMTFNGSVVRTFSPAAMSRLGIARTFQISRVHGRLPVLENVLVGAANQSGERPFRAVFAPRLWRNEEATLRDEATDLLRWVGLEKYVEQPAGVLSGGQRRLLEIARALMAHPKMLLLDEPTAGVFPETSRMIGDRICEVAARGTTVLVIAHNMGFLSAVADDVVVMGQGRVIVRGDLDAVRADPRVVSAYLGGPTALGAAHGVAE
ncbi:MAG TPA: ABC transporter ATP-binding protein [Jatrophihabitans sp.]|jgi:ABC-type branched-subunit amino acid transport system ATPase component